MSENFARVDATGAVLAWPLSAMHVRNLGLPPAEVERVASAPRPPHDLRREYVAEVPPQRDGSGRLVQTWEVRQLGVAEMQRRLVAHLADVRWQREVGGIEVGGLPVRTDDKSQARLSAAQASFARGLVNLI